MQSHRRSQARWHPIDPANNYRRLSSTADEVIERPSISMVVCAENLVRIDPMTESHNHLWDGCVEKPA